MLIMERAIDVSLISNKYRVRLLSREDVPEVVALCSKNEQYYRYCPPFVSEQSIIEDMNALPPRKEAGDKYYIGYYDGDKLTAVMDLIVGFPNSSTAFIGFFMVAAEDSGRGIGTGIIDELCAFLKENGFEFIRLGRAKGNPQPERFWHKNGFVETGVSYDTEDYTVIVMEREL